MTWTYMCDGTGLDGTGISDRPTTIAPLKAVLIILTVPQNSSCGPKVISYIRESDIRGALGPIHCIITLKACAMALGDGTKCKIYFTHQWFISKKILWGNFFLVQGGFGKIPHFSRVFFRTPSLMYDITLGPHEEFYGTVSII